MKWTADRLNPRTFASALFDHVQTYRLFWLMVLVGIGAAVALRSIWLTYGDPALATAGSIDLALGLVALNFVLAGLALPREPFASILLVGSALILEGLVMVFLYQV